MKTLKSSHPAIYFAYFSGHISSSSYFRAFVLRHFKGNHTYFKRKIHINGRKKSTNYLRLLGGPLHLGLYFVERYLFSGFILVTGRSSTQSSVVFLLLAIYFLCLTCPWVCYFFTFWSCSCLIELDLMFICRLDLIRWVVFVDFISLEMCFLLIFLESDVCCLNDFAWWISLNRRFDSLELIIYRYNRCVFLIL